MIIISGLTKFYGEQILFNDVNLTIAPKEKIGLVGRNGSGKSTFLKILLGEEEADGDIKIPPYYRIRALEQHLNFSEATILKQVAAALPDNSVNEEWKAKSVLMGLGFIEEDFDRASTEFSSGFQVRIRLAEALVSESDLLLLDEPTNYLDILSLRWLERFLKSWNGCFILVTHDQHFMDQVVSHTVAIHRGRMNKMKGGPKKLMAQIYKDEQVYEKTRKNQVKKREKDEIFIRTFRAGARSAGLVQSRIKAINKKTIGGKLDHIPDIKFDFKSLPCKSNAVIQATDITFGYDPEYPLIKEFSLTTVPGDRIAIIGRNGKGKSTMLRLLHETLKPQEGMVRKPPTLKVGYFGVDSKKDLSMEKNILEELIGIPNTTEQQIRNLCGSLLFQGDAVKKKINNLSGGEKSRVCLGKVLLHPSQLLMLDEPSNHLDMESIQALTDAIEKYEGTVIFVTHNEDMLSALATRLVVFDNNKIKVLNHGYDKFLKDGGWSEEDDEAFKASRENSDRKEQHLNRKALRAGLRGAKSQQKKVEKEIEKLEKESASNATALNEACLNKKVDQIKDLGIKASDFTTQIEKKYQELENSMTEEERISKELEV